ncbi:interactor of HORMAD1 protein 1 [Thalassophryne amazonica]|uniref:interactor of HORMAD1 protein 1 n=1 Tax=Thalassophryne amazonica TaxID=390379 RepID=UPI0014723EBD|nr:interactor of HORMAD1 protein 1 [Thalassophryne amazonica]
MSLSSRTSQQSSQEASDPRFSTNYHTKPLLFGVEGKDKTRAPGILDKFEEYRKKVKDKNDSDNLAKECVHFRETLNNVKQLLTSTESNTLACKTILEGFNNFASTLQNNLASLQSHTSQQFEALLNNVTSQKGLMTHLEERVDKTGDITAELGSNINSLKNSMVTLREEQEREKNMLEEVLNLLSALVSKHSVKPEHVTLMDCAIQTSPGMAKPFSCIQQDSKPEASLLPSTSDTQVQNQVTISPQDPCSLKGKRKRNLRRPRSRTKRPLALSQPRKGSGMVSDENCIKQQNVSTLLWEHCDENRVNIRSSLKPEVNNDRKAAGCLLTPLSYWSQDSNSSVGISAIEPILEKLSAECKSENPTPQKLGGLWSLFAEKCCEQRRPLCIAFIDLTKVFDLVSRQGLFTLLQMIGFPPKLLKMITSFHEEMKSTVQYDGSSSEPIPIKSRVKQG